MWRAPNLEDRRMIQWQRLKDVLANKVVIGCADGMSRLFVRCFKCRAVVPAWNIFGHPKERDRTGCKCGSQHVVPSSIGFWRGAWFYFVRGLLIRRLILRKSNCDPRIPKREAHA